MSSGADIIEDDSLIAIPAGSEGMRDDPAPAFSPFDIAETMALGHLTPAALTFLDNGHAVGDVTDGASSPATVFTVCLSAAVAKSAVGLVAGRRYTLAVGHIVYPGGGAEAADADDILRAEWAIFSGAVGAHASISTLYAHWVDPPPAETRAGLPSKVLAALNARPGAALSMLLTDATLPLPPSRLPFSSLFGFALDLLRGCVHLARRRVAHRAIGPARLCFAADVSPLEASQSIDGMSDLEQKTTGGAGRLLISRMSSAVSFPRSSPGSYSLSMTQKMSLRSGSSERSLLGLCSSSDAPFVAPELHLAARVVSAGLATVAPCAKVDVWSTAATLLTLALGNHPLSGYPDAGSADRLTSSAMMDDSSDAAAPQVDLASVPALPCDFPPAFGRLLMWMLRPNPAMRITAVAALGRLESLATGSPMRASPFLNFEPGSGYTGTALRAELPSEQLQAGMSPSLRGALSGTGVVLSSALRNAKLAASASAGNLVDSDGDGSVTMGDDDSNSGQTREMVTKASWTPVVSALSAAIVERMPTDDFVPIAVVPYVCDDFETVGAIISRAAELIDLGNKRLGIGRSDENSLALPALLDSRGRRIDPLVPFHRLPESIRNGAALRLALASDVSSDISIFVEGFGCTIMPAAPQVMPAVFLNPPQLVPVAGIREVMAAVGPGALDVPPHAFGTAVGQQYISTNTITINPYLPGLAPPPSAAQELLASERLSPGYSFSPYHCSNNLQLSEFNTLVSTRAQWGSVLLAQGRVGLRYATNVPSPLQTSPLPTRFSVSFTVRAIDTGAGITIGLIDPSRFDPLTHVFGNTLGSWGYSRSGKISDGSGVWCEYGEPFGVNDVIQLDVTLCENQGTEVSRDMSSLRFSKNGIPQGKAYIGADLLSSKDGGSVNLVPAVCLGSASGNKNVAVEVKHPVVYEFDFEKRHPRINFSEDGSTVSNEGKWATALAAHPGVRSGRLDWSVRLDDTRHGAGVAVGVVDATKFHWEKQNLGASKDSWCYSKTGKKGDGTGFHEYGKQYANGDTITLTLDMDARELSFAINGESQGVAYTEADGIGRVPLVPAVCLGSTDGKRMATVSIEGMYPILRRFNRFSCSKKVTLKEMGRVAETYDKWGTVFLDHPGLRTGRFSFGITVANAGSGCGVGIGFADVNKFNPATKNLGACDGSWCFSKTGKISLGTSFVPYGKAFASDDVVTAEVDMDLEILRFYINGKPQGDKEAKGIKGCVLVPAVVLGSGDGGHYTKLTIGLPAVSRFDTRRMHKHMSLKDNDRTAHTSERWCSVLADHPGVMAPGILRFAVRLEGEGGTAIGFAEAQSFRPYAQNLGASPFTWAISKTGKISSGDPLHGFQHFSEKFKGDDVIGAEADLNEGIIRFWKNGNLLGTAFSNIDNSRAGRPLTLVPAVCLGSNTGEKSSSATLVDFDEAWIRY